MSNGSSQGLFVVVAIVIFGIFIGMIQTLYGHEFKKGLVGLFTESTDVAYEKVTDREHINYFPDIDFEEEKTLYENFSPRETIMEVDTKDLHNGDNTLHIQFLNVGSQYKYTDDVVLWLTSDRFKEVIEQDTLTISFYAKAKEPVILTGRLGSHFELKDKDKNEEVIDYTGQGLQQIKVTEDWKEIEFVFDVNMIGASGYDYPAFVFWLEDKGEVWLSDFKIEIGREYVE